MENKRIKFTENQKLHLFAEVNAVCPLCPSLLMYEKKGKKEKEFEIAHIYPLNPKPDEKILLENEEKLSTDPNHLDNLICLCVSCHTKFDKPRTVEEYRDLILVKKKLISQFNEKELWKNSKVEDEIYQIINFLSENDLNLMDNIELNYDPKKIDDKTDDSITFLTKRLIKLNVQDYYHLIKEKFSEIDLEIPLTTETISSQIKSHYLTLRKQNVNSTQKMIFDGMVSWLYKMTNQTSFAASEIIISYFVQNCEVFE
ncbi:HNH endonuclease [Marinifilum breve]|uniref:HNH endonuclease n=1 Tax=Marinifilum breve TaxID=2184082 RepID=A0A2V3ZRE8_9BACT|nr:ABC-three component system protein [Marinifilum breve]PXX95446.1 HNH endonuclease [Marinifilum breve]